VTPAHDTAPGDAPNRDAARDEIALAVVGAGRMGSAVIHGALRAGELRPADLGVFHPDAQRRESLATRFGITPLDDAGVHRAERVLIAVKPQSFERVAPLIARRHAGFVSIMAGVTLATLAKRLGSSRVVRAMPNLGARVGASATALAWTP
jgi:pyrroline-5-carboxylate reductase